jgi:hypothetical protein
VAVAVAAAAAVVAGLPCMVTMEGCQDNSSKAKIRFKTSLAAGLPATLAGLTTACIHGGTCHGTITTIINKTHTNRGGISTGTISMGMISTATTRTDVIIIIARTDTSNGGKASKSKLAAPPPLPYHKGFYEVIIAGTAVIAGILKGCRYRNVEQRAGVADTKARSVFSSLLSFLPFLPLPFSFPLSFLPSSPFT